MNKEFNSWSEEVIHSMGDSQKAMPRLFLYAKVENYAFSQTKIFISLRMVAVVTSLLILFNFLLIYKLHKKNTTEIAMKMQDDRGSALISNFLIYDHD